MYGVSFVGTESWKSASDEENIAKKQIAQNDGNANQCGPVVWNYLDV